MEPLTRDKPDNIERRNNQVVKNHVKERILDQLGLDSFIFVPWIRRPLSRPQKSSYQTRSKNENPPEQNHVGKSKPAVPIKPRIGNRLAAQIQAHNQKSSKIPSNLDSCRKLREECRPSSLTDRQSEIISDRGTVVHSSKTSNRSRSRDGVVETGTLGPVGNWSYILLIYIFNMIF